MKRIVIGAWAAACLSLVAGCHALVEPSAERRVLFIGNSYTYYNNMPEIFRTLAESAGVARHVQTTMLVEGGRNLAEAWADDEVRGALQDGPWDIVVLQEQSSLGTALYVDGSEFLPADGGTLPDAAGRFVRSIGELGAEALLLEHWPKQRASSRDRNVLRTVFCSVADASGAHLVPVGQSWALADKAGIAATLYDEDGSHPSPQGSYLIALTLLAALGFELPDDLPRTVQGAGIDEDTGKPLEGGSTPLVELDQAESRALRQAAVHAVATAQCETLADLPPPPTVAPLGPGRPVSRGDVLGSWRGETVLYPSSMLPSPGVLELTFSQGEKGLIAAVRVTFPGVSFQEQATKMPVEIDDTEIRFTNPDAINNGSIVYRARLVGSRRLEGVASLVTDDPMLQLVGSWNAGKQSRP